MRSMSIVILFLIHLFVKAVGDFTGEETIVEHQSALYLLNRHVRDNVGHTNVTKIPKTDIALEGNIKNDEGKIKEKGKYGDFNNDNQETFAPRFVTPTRLYYKVEKPAGSYIRLKCVSEANPSPNITWFKNDGNVTASHMPSYGEWSLTLEKLAESDSGRYTCVVCNILGCINHTIILIVVEPNPKKLYIEEGFPQNQTVVQRGTAQFSCPTVSSIEPYVFWTQHLISNITLNDTNIRDDIILSDNHLDPRDELTIYNVTCEDEGWYTCTASNSLGTVTARGYLKVLKVSDASSLKQNTGNPSSNIIISGVLGAIIVLIVTVLVIVVIKLRRDSKRKQHEIETARELLGEQWTKIVKIEKLLNTETTARNNTMITPVVTVEKIRYSQLPEDKKNEITSEYILALDFGWEISKDNLTLDEVLGEGEFGIVLKAKCIGLEHMESPCTVAVKMLKESHSDEDMVALVSEMEIMKIIGQHEHIINLLGCCSQDGPLLVVVEYACHGNLKDYLKNHRHIDGDDYEELTDKDLISFSHQVAKGMEYLASKGCIHRDLAARNVLVAARRVLKIADFGLARDVRDSHYYRKTTAGRLPARWMAPESLACNLYTSQSDVWTFGILMWEIMTFGCNPHSNIHPQLLFKHLQAGNRMEKPVSCNLETYALMMKCWSFLPDDRPSFSEVVKVLQQIFINWEDSLKVITVSEEIC